MVLIQVMNYYLLLPDAAATALDADYFSVNPIDVSNPMDVLAQ